MISKGNVRAIAAAVSLALAHASAMAGPSSPSTSVFANLRSADAIIGGDTDAIIGGDLLSKLSAGVVTHGPIESIDLVKGQITVLGQTYQGQTGSPALDAIAGQLATGSTLLVTVTGHANRKGGSPRVTAMSFSQEQYVAGATVVQVVGKVGKVSPELGSLKIGNLSVDYSALLAKGELTIRQGQVIAVAGVQASKTQPLQALAVVAL